jgi:ubiquinone/menaquinone biosynthesis C-methylase UbiE
VSFIIAQIYDALLAPAEWLCLADWRRNLVGSLSGSVLEIGAGTGRNLEHYGSAVERLVLTEPTRHMRRKLSARLRESPRRRRVELSAQTSETMDFAAGSFDAVVSTFVLCSVADPGLSIREMFRILRPGGKFLFIEHILAPEGSPRRRWQRRIAPVWNRFSDGCHLDRDPRDALRDAGFETQSLLVDELRGAPAFLRTALRGVCVKPDDA